MTYATPRTAAARPRRWRTSQDRHPGSGATPRWPRIRAGNGSRCGEIRSAMPRHARATRWSATPTARATHHARCRRPGVDAHSPRPPGAGSAPAWDRGDAHRSRSGADRSLTVQCGLRRTCGARGARRLADRAGPVRGIRRGGEPMAVNAVGDPQALVGSAFHAPPTRSRRGARSCSSSRPCARAGRWPCARARRWRSATRPRSSARNWPRSDTTSRSRRRRSRIVTRPGR